MSLISNAPIRARAHRLPRLIERLKEENIHAPVQNPTNSIRPVRLGRIHSRNRTLVRTSSSRPSCLSNPQLRRIIRTASDILDMSKSLHDIIKETRRRIRQCLSLPIRERIAQQNIHAAFNQRVGRAVLVFVPGICGADFEAGPDGFFCVLDLLKEFGTREVAPVEGFGTDGYGVDLVAVLGSVFHDCGFVCCVGFVGIRPAGTELAIDLNASEIDLYIPNAQDDLKSSGLSSRENLLGGVAVAGCVDSNKLGRRIAADSREVRGVIGLELACSICLLVTECES